MNGDFKGETEKCFFNNINKKEVKNRVGPGLLMVVLLF